MKYRLNTSLLTRNIFCCCRVAGVQSARGGAAATRDLNVCSHCSPIIAMIASLLLASPGPGQVFTTVLLLPPVNISICSAGAPPHIHNSLLSYTGRLVAKLKIIASVHIQHQPSCNSWKCSAYKGNEPHLIVNTLKLVTMNRKLLLKGGITLRVEITPN